MLFSKTRLLTFWFLAGLSVSRAFEGDEEPCPAFANQTDGGFPSCLACVENDCGYAADEGDCVKDCSTVTDTECFSLAVNTDVVDAEAVCALAQAGGGGGGGADGPTSAPAEEEMCAAFEGSSTAATCETCLSAGCGWTEDDGDCLKDCGEVNDGAACLSLKDGENATSVCEASAMPGEEMCAAFEGSSTAATCETCLEAGCGWTEDDGDCLKDCGEVNDGAACLSLKDGESATSVCEASAMPEEEMCAAFEGSSTAATCETCLSAGCGWTEDDGDCLKDCGEVNDGAACLSLKDGESAASVCGGPTSGGGAAPSSLLPVAAAAAAALFL